MSKDNLSTNLRKFYDEMNERLKALPPEQQQQYLEGLVHAFDSVTRYTLPEQVTPFERENFIAYAKSCAYSKTDHLGLDPDTKMRGLIESDGEGVAKLYAFAVEAQEALGIPLTTEQAMKLQQVILVYQFEKAGKK